jgi:uncharacterized Fe-S cluster-containing MiaB family protein
MTTASEIRDLISKYGIEVPSNKKITKDQLNVLIPLLSEYDLHIFAIFLADMKIRSAIGLSWDNLSDTNSMHDYINKGMSAKDFYEAVENAVNDRINSEINE